MKNRVPRGITLVLRTEREVEERATSAGDGEAASEVRSFRGRSLHGFRHRHPARHRDHPRRRSRVLGHWLLRWRDRHSQPGPARPRRRAVHELLFLRQVLPHARLAAHRALPAPGGHRAHDGPDREEPRSLPHAGPRCVCRHPRERVHHPRRGARGGRLPDPALGKMARRPGTSELAGRSRIRALLRTDQRGVQLLLARGAPAVRRPGYPRGIVPGGFLHHRLLHPECRAVHRRGGCPQALLPVRRVHRAPLAAARVATGHREVPAALPARMGRTARRAVPAAAQPGALGRRRLALRS